ncbi:hypothetical protein [Pyrobaculum ferrireducens]|uniref:Uncharacterized protein n=1 Tax=Pyrobaculum ferrireducens TaxID=1104324 RepID=G7VCM5_9CREN|nr:hypothetical protein [Pyrobaculum ferrireducens]AET33830.1 hypothetical protein P186_2444 [Pyrobaculum ferrireducens]
MWWSIFFTIASVLLLVVVGIFAVLGGAYREALEAYRLAKFALDQWTSLTSQLNSTICLAAETLAKKAVAELDAEVYRSLGPMFSRAMEQVKNKSLLKRLNYSWGFSGDVFQWNVTFLRHRARGAVDWLRPTLLIDSVEKIKSASFDLTQSTVEDTLRQYLPKNAALRGVVYGYLYGNGTYSGYLTGEYTLTDKTPLRCLEGSISVSFTATHYATLTANGTAPSVYIYHEVNIEN